MEKNARAQATGIVEELEESDDSDKNGLVAQDEDKYLKTKEIKPTLGLTRGGSEAFDISSDSNARGSQTKFTDDFKS